MEHFLEIVHLQQAEAESILSALECLKKKSLQVGKIVGMGFDGAATFLGKKSGVQASMKKFVLHALCTATAICGSWLAFKLRIQHLELNTFIRL